MPNQDEPYLEPAFWAGIKLIYTKHAIVRAAERGLPPLVFVVPWDVTIGKHDDEAVCIRFKVETVRIEAAVKPLAVYHCLCGGPCPHDPADWAAEVLTIYPDDSRRTERRTRREKRQFDRQGDKRRSRHRLPPEQKGAPVSDGSGDRVDP